MGITPRPSFARVARARSAEQGMVEQAAREGLIPPDIAGALADPDVTSHLLFTGFEVVADLESLTGPASGEVEVPTHLRDGELGAHADLSDPWQRETLYGRVLVDGSAADQAGVLNRQVLSELWHKALAPGPVLRVWQGRFPELAIGQAAL
jgi:hypothetical protein